MFRQNVRRSRTTSGCSVVEGFVVVYVSEQVVDITLCSQWDCAGKYLLWLRSYPMSVLLGLAAGRKKADDAGVTMNVASLDFHLRSIAVR